MRVAGFPVWFLILSLASAGSAQVPPVAERITLSYADLADLALPAQVVAQVRISQAIALKGAQAAQVPPGMTRFYVEADVITLIRGPAGTPAQVRYLVDAPVAAKDAGTKIKRKGEYLLLASPGSRIGELRLASRDSQLAWSPALGERVRSLLREAAAPDAAPAIVGIGKGFHVPGTLPGESETQLFLLATDNRPISLSVLRRPGQAPTWAVALGEIVDEAAAAPAKDSLLWYRLACTLPPALPPQSYADTDAASAAAIRADYSFVIDQLGPCIRNRTSNRRSAA